ncbi:hypothetical protein DICPUDRAFT_158038 [Dictyostelium purpureum]|uniref:U3 small nucleolar RNA-associated protein 6 n=1 Tax=Dictyostelium purpureum TaxID=5786 RepID=F1A0N5_DICPU|nr:uncharacterized protein DICPUDRAFT_158038 [Dictyostelium purpureum]EGC30237.1 hypothetical protein DICPUDRAFT_158038 [Dictyostelium purpureum]|eukprot:XP_003293229.1 hypothetical protein DICPUDRAFT_158038 [Dictyostelium purpureum]
MDKVNYSIDQLLDETTKLVSMGIITKQECKDIMKKREYHEIKIYNRNAHKSDFLTYIKYELDLDKLFHERGKEKHIEFDFRLRSALRHAFILFGSATKKFPKDESLWISSLNIRMRRASKEGTGRLFSIALQNLPRSPRLWKLAATFEFEVNKNIQNARNLIQAGIQFNKTDHSLWHHFFLMELTYISLLYSDINYLDEINKNQNSTKEDESTSIRLNLDNMRKEEKVEKDELITFGKDILNAEKLKQSPLIRGQIAQIVYNKAINSIKDDFDFRKKFYIISSKFLNVGKDEQNPVGAGELLQKEIIKSLKQDFENSDKTYLFLASIEQSNLQETIINKVKSSTEILKQGLYVIKNEDYLFSTIDFIKKETILNIKLKDSSIVEDISKTILQFYKYSIENQFLKENGYYFYIELLLEIGLMEEAIKVSEESLNLFKNSPKLWKQRINLLIKNSVVLKLFENLNLSLDINNVDKCFEMAIKHSSIEKCLLSSNVILDYFKYQVAFKFEKDYNKIIELFKKLIRLSDGNNSVQTSLKNFILDYTFLNLPKDKLKPVYQLCFNYLPIEKEFYQKCILYQEDRIEKDFNDIRSLYEHCLSIKTIETKDKDMWLNYRNFELKVTGDIQRANTIAVRGKKSLEDPLEFISQL